METSDSERRLKSLRGLQILTTHSRRRRKKQNQLTDAGGFATEKPKSVTLCRNHYFYTVKMFIFAARTYIPATKVIIIIMQKKRRRKKVMFILVTRVSVRVTTVTKIKLQTKAGC